MRTICFIFKARDTIIRVECAYNGEGRKNRRNRLVMVRWKQGIIDIMDVAYEEISQER